MEEKQPKILILRLSSIGDILLTSSFIRQVRIQFSDARIDFVIKKQFVDLVKFNPHLNKIYSFDPNDGISGLLKMGKHFADQGYDYIFDLHNNMRTRILTSRIKDAKKGKIKKDKLKRALLVYAKLNLLKKHPAIPERYLKAGAFAGISDDGNGLELFWKNNIEKKIKEILNNHKISTNYVVIAPGAGFFSKRWPIEYVQELIETISAKRKEKILLVGGKNEQNEYARLLIKNGVTNLAGKLSLLESAAIINGARCVISNDSGVMHMATAVQTPVIAVFGSTVKELGFYPFRSKHIVLENKDLKCRPCSHVGKNRCPRGHFKCMKEIRPELVFNHLKKLLT